MLIKRNRGVPRKRRPDANPGGRPITPMICPTCGLMDRYGKMYGHVSQCPQNDPRVITVDEWLDEVADRQYTCPVGCGEQHSYRDMLRHIPTCPKQSEIYPWTKARWLKELIDNGRQPGANVAETARRARVRKKAREDAKSEEVVAAVG